MAKATCVLSTPPTNTPTDTTRRRLLTIAAGGAVAAAIPTYALGHAADRAFALIAEKLAADEAHCRAIDAQDEAETCHGFRSEAAAEAADNCAAAGHAVNEIDWKLANTLPTTLAGVAAVLRFANEIEDTGMEWPHTDTVGREGWHYQLPATVAAAIEALIKAQAGRAVQA
jgi:hypothetical protein